ncbi:MAG: c-type cytochrome [Gammaproteobacteria bacterium]|nr:c-type cytochrome [Gammaproteobacteria bacterium]
MFMALIISPAAFADGDPEAGKAQAAPCGACHGQDGASPIDPTYAVLAGQNEKYLLRQLQLIQSNDRPVPLMAGQLNGKSDEDLADLAAYYASLPDKVGQAQGDDETLAMAEQIYRGGILDKGVAACTACHAPSGDGNAPAGFPAIGGQPKAYTVAQLTAYREGERTTDQEYGAMMRNIAARLTDREIAALADYIQGLH